MMELLNTACEFALAGVMLAILILSCGAALALVALIGHVSNKAYIKIRAHLRHRRAVREFNEKYKNAKEDIHAL